MIWVCHLPDRAEANDESRRPLDSSSVRAADGRMRNPVDSLCGVKSVYIALVLVNRESSCQAILKEMPPSVYGSSMKQIVDCLTAHGVRAKAVRGSCRELYGVLLSNEDKVAIVDLAGHWVVVRKASRKECEVIDYPRKFSMPVQDMELTWDGYAVLIDGETSPKRMTFSVVAGGIAILGVMCFAWSYLRRRSNAKGSDGVNVRDGVASE